MLPDIPEQPKIGDYVFCELKGDYSTDYIIKINLLLKNNIGVISKINEFWTKPYIISFENEILKKLLSKHNFSRNEIKFYTEDKKKLLKIVNDYKPKYNAGDFIEICDTRKLKIKSIHLNEYPWIYNLETVDGLDRGLFKEDAIERILTKAEIDNLKRD